MKPLKGIFFRDLYDDYVHQIFKEIFIDGIYFSFIKDQDVVVDIGANIGMFTLFAYRLASKIYAVEPSKQHVETIQKMIEFNKMDDKVTVVPVGISNFIGSHVLYHMPNTTVFTLSDIASNLCTGKENVEIITLKKLFDDYKIEHVNLMKVDVEGEEFKIFTDPTFKEVASKIDIIVTEWHEWTNISPHLLKASFIDSGFKVERLVTDATIMVARRI